MPYKRKNLDVQSRNICVESECGCVYNHQSEHTNNTKEARRKSSSAGLSNWRCFRL